MSRGALQVILIIACMVIGAFLIMNEQNDGWAIITMLFGFIVATGE